MADPAPGLKRRERVERALANPVYFGEAYIRPYDPNWIAPLPVFAHEMLAFVLQVQRGVVMLPPEFLKTTLISQVYALWRTYRARAFGQLLRGMLMSEEEGMAKGNLQVVRWHIENNDRLNSDFVEGDGKTPAVRRDADINVWRDDALVVVREGTSRDPTWQAKGLDSKGIHGRRLDLFIGDDLVTPRNAESPAMRKNALDTMDLQVETRVVADGQMIVAGNFNDDKDLPSVLSRRPRWRAFRRPSMHVPGKPWIAPPESDLHDEAKAIPTWPSNWTRTRLLEEYEEKPNRFRRIHLLDPRAETGEALSIEWLQVIEPPQTPLRYARFYISIDPAPGGEGADLDFFDISVVALHEAGIDLVESHDFRSPLPTQVEHVGLIHDRWQRMGAGVVAIGCSKIALDAYFRASLEIDRPDLAHKIEAIRTPGSKEIRLAGLGPQAKTGWFRVWSTVLHGLTSSPQDRAEELTLFEQWRDFPFGRHDDRLDGLDLAIRTAREFASVGEVEWDLEVLER